MAEIKYLDYEGLKALYGVVDSKIKVETDRAKAAEGELSARIDAMDLDDTAQDGQFVTAVKQTDGQISVSRGTVAADKVTAVAVTGDDTVAIEGTTVAAQIKSLGQTLKTVGGNAAKYEVEEVTTDLPANVRTRYQVVSYVGDSATADKTKVGEFIDIPKDGQLINVEPMASGQGIKFTYSTGDGADNKTIEIDLGKAIFESEIGHGLQVNDSVVSVKLAEGSESFLTVGEGGVKLAGVQSAIDAAVAAKNVDAEGDAYVSASATGNKVSVSANVQSLTVNKSGDADSTIAGVAQSLVDGAEVATKVASFTNARIREEIAKLDATVGGTTFAEGKHVAVQVVETDGKLTDITVSESDIASATALSNEVSRAKDAEAKALADAKAYTDGQFTSRTTLAGYGITDAKIEGQTITLGDVQLTFTAFTEKEIQDAAKPSAE